MPASARRGFLKDVLAAGLLPALAPMGAAAAEVLQQNGAAAGFEIDQQAFEFWNGFLSTARVPETTTRGVPSGLERDAFFFHYGSDGLRAAMDIAPTDLLPGGDVAVSMNVVAFRPGDEDRATFERLSNAQLRVDFVQGVPLLDVLDTMAWTAVAALHPDRTNKLPPIQNLAFDPGATWQKMQNIMLPGGQGQWAVNLYAQKKDSFFAQVLRVITQEVPRFAPVLGLPGISTAALQSFNALYGAFHNSPQYLFKTNPVPIFGTQAAFRSAPAARGLPLRTGTYLLVPLQHADQLTPDRFDAFELKQGLIVPKNTTGPDLYDRAAKALPGVTYATIDVVVRQAQLQVGNGQKGAAGAAPSAAPDAEPANGAPTPAPAPGGRGGRGGTTSPPGPPAPPAGGQSGRGRS